MTHKPTLVQKVLGALRGGRTLELLDDQVQSPTYAPDLAADILGLIKAQERGVFHCAGPTASTRLEFGRAVAGVYGLDEGLLRGVHLAQAGMPAPRPPRVPLARAKVDGATGGGARTLRAALQEFKAAEGAG
jgi:dTDP-4-dehydrorhamnose reductase